MIGVIDAAFQSAWHAYVWVLTYMPFFAQPVTIFILVTNIGLAIYESVDRVSWGPLNRFKPVSLHPHTTTGSGERIIGSYSAWGQWAPALLWNSFPFATYALVDLAFGTQTLCFYRGNGVASATAAAAAPLPAWLPVTFFVGTGASDIAAYERMAFPGAWKFCTDLALLLLGFDAAMYFFHRILHVKAVYNSIHHAHHKVKFPYPATIYYVEMIDGLINFTSLSMPSLIAYFALDMHPLTHVLFSALIAALGAAAHSGFDVFFSATFHFCHHVLGDCNYGGLGLFDVLFGTYISFDRLKATHPAYAVAGAGAGTPHAKDVKAH